jgi:uncharacterized protein with ParB-like and HNH nuclease domain
MAELASQPTSVQSAYASYRDDKLYVNRCYQRKLVWTLEEKQKLIESILKRYPVPVLAARAAGSGEKMHAKSLDAAIEEAACLHG